jgi:dipeptidyl aminopeptidase/acylaminoacyl peptidase
LLCVREDHIGLRSPSKPRSFGGQTGETAGGPSEPVNTIVAISFTGEAEKVLVSGADFYSDPVLSPDGSRLAWLQWNHPNMPWDGTELWVADVNADGSLGAREKIAGGTAESIFQPEWSPDGRLYFVSDRTRWWNIYRTAPAASAFARANHGELRRDRPEELADIEALYSMAADFGKPQWTFSQSSYAFITANRLVVTYTEAGRWKMALLDIEPRTFEPIDLRLEATDGVRATTRDIFFIGGSPTDPLSIGRVTPDSSQPEIFRASTEDRIDPAWISTAEALTFQSEGRPVHAFYYTPKNPNVSAPQGDRPPLLVLSHGGPTSATEDVLDPELQFWTSRGFAILDVNYSGSSGYGRDYRDRLKGQWGIADVADVVNGAKQLVAAGKADPNRLIIRGGSAGGYTTLAALTFHDTFKAGASYYGISDTEVLATDTHKFESRYLDSLIGPYPALRDRYRERSPIHFTERLSCALILFQGLEDKVVPPNQSEMMAAAVRQKGLPVAYVPFEGEQHGFRKVENIIRSLEAELYFYGAVFGFKPADPIDPVQIDNLTPRFT